MRIHNFFLQNGNSRPVSNVRLLRAEGISIPEEWQKNLLLLSGEEEYRSELHQLLGEMQDQIPKN